MPESATLLAVFEDVDPAANAIERLHNLGVTDDQINVISGIPIQGRVLGLPGALTNVSRIGLLGAILGMFLGFFLAYGTPYLYPLPVGGQPIFPVPIGLITVFEMTMLGLMGFSFLGLFVDSGFPSYTPKHYVPEISDGRIAILFSYPIEEQQKFVDAMKNMGAESVAPAEARHL
jgi:hypothetical protein